jgi:hypothetical protein
LQPTKFKKRKITFNITFPFFLSLRCQISIEIISISISFATNTCKLNALLYLSEKKKFYQNFLINHFDVQAPVGVYSNYFSTVNSWTS